jgi:chromosome segregation ATPase
MSGCKCMTPKPTQIHHNRIKQLEAELLSVRELLANNLYDGTERITELEAERNKAIDANAALLSENCKLILERDDALNAHKVSDEWRSHYHGLLLEGDALITELEADLDKLRDTVTLSADRNTELEAEVEDLENKLATGVHTCSSTCKRPMCVLRKERNKLREALQEIADGKHHGLDKIGSPAFARKTLGDKP